MTTAALFVLLCLARLASGQTVGTGSIVRVVSDPSGAKITITNAATGQVVELTTSSSGSSNSGALVPGKHKTLVSAKAFRSVEAEVTVFLGNTATMNVNLQFGQERQVVKVQGSEMQVNMEQPTVQRALTAEQIENLPVNGRRLSVA